MEVFGALVAVACLLFIFSMIRRGINRMRDRQREIEKDIDRLIRS
jgi:hypothetical protein